jgi:hypothetical protein
MGHYIPRQQKKTAILMPEMSDSAIAVNSMLNGAFKPPEPAVHPII